MTLKLLANFLSYLLRKKKEEEKGEEKHVKEKGNKFLNIYNIMYKETNIIHYLNRRALGIRLPYFKTKIVLFPRPMYDY